MPGAPSTISQPVIAAGASLSNAVDATLKNIRAIIFPAAWSGNAILTFQGSADGTTFYDIYRPPTGELLQITVTPGAMVVLEKDIWHALFYKFRSGAPKSPAVQQQARTFICVLEA